MTAAETRLGRVYLGFSRFPAARAFVDSAGTATVRWNDIRFVGGLLTLNQPERRPDPFNAVVSPAAPREVWRKAFEGLMAPLDAFAPDLILISAGFDAHAADPLAEQLLEAEDYAWATRAIADVARARCGGRIVSSLEGGYDLEALGQSALAHVRALQEG